MAGPEAGYPAKPTGLRMSNAVYLISMFAFFLLLAGGGYLIYSARQIESVDPGRRSLLSWKRESNGYALFLGLQIAVKVFGTDSLRSQLAGLILPVDPGSKGDDDSQSGDAVVKREFLKSLSSLLIENRYAWEYGFWDYRQNATEAIDQFSQWKNEIESAIATADDEVGAAPDQLHRTSNEKEFLIVSLMLLIDNRDIVVEDDEGEYDFRPTYAGLASPFLQLIESIRTEEFWAPETFERILEAIRVIDPRSIERDAIFLLPGSSEDGISEIDLLGDPEWKYLTDHPIRAI
ncbi:MAG: hypothetical protein EBZ36_09250 [Acidobacteria bacterium]|nr:hypothetical protein [Acidobacteriota bacterium]